MVHFDMSADTVNRHLFSRDFRLGFKDGLGHFEHRLDGSHGKGDSGQRGEGTHDAPVGSGKGVVLVFSYAGLDGQVIQYDRTEKGDGGRNDTV